MQDDISEELRAEGCGSRTKYFPGFQETWMKENTVHDWLEVNKMQTWEMLESLREHVDHESQA